MKKVLKPLALALLIAAPWGKGGQLNAGRQPILPMYYEIEPVSYNKSTGQLVLEFRITGIRFDSKLATCDAVTVRAAGVDGLQYSGPEQWLAPVDRASTPLYATRLEVTVPPNDTSGLEFVIECGGYR
jgi:hypothetical protein